MPRSGMVLASAITLWASLALGQQYPFVQVTKPGDPAFLGAMLQDRQGRLWVGGASGAAVYDGVRFYSMLDFGMRQGPPGDKEVRGFAEDGKGGVWICSFGGIYRFHNGQLSLLAAGACTSIVRATPGIILAALNPSSKAVSGSTYLYRFLENRGSWNIERIAGIVLTNPAPSNVFVTVDDQGSALYPCKGGWCELPASVLGGVQQDIAAAQKVHSAGLRDIKEIVRDRFGCLWFVTTSDAFEQCPQDPHPVSLPTQFTNVNVQIQEVADGRVLISSEGGGIAIGRPSHYQFVTPRNGLPDSQSALLARDGTIWVAGDQGLARLAYPFRMEYWTSHDGLNGAFAIARLGAHVLAGSGKDLVALDPDRSRWSVLPHARGLGTVMRLLPSASGTLFALLHRPANPLVEISSDGRVLRELHSPDSGRWLLLSRDQRLWMTNRGGPVAVQRISAAGNRLTAFPEALPGDGRDAIDIEQSRIDESIWACYSGGLADRRQSGWMLAANRDTGLTENACGAMATYPNGDIWYGYLNLPGIAQIHFPRSGDYHHAEVRNYFTHASTGSATHFIGVDRRGWIWVGDSEGLSIATPRQAEEGTWWRLTETDGLPSVSTNQGSFMVDADSSVWFAVDTSIVHFRPNADFVESGVPPSVFISAFSSNGGPPRLADVAASFKSRADITAHIGSLQFDRRNALRLRYRLLPEQASWRDAATFDVKLGVLHWGEHTLEVQARLGPGSWSQTVKRSFTVLKPIWLTWPSLLALTALAVGAAGGGFAWHRKRVQRQQKILPDLRELRLAALSPEIQFLEGGLLDERFEVGRVLARGGFATVAEGRDLQKGGCRCAVKIFRQEWADNEWMASRFRKEVRALEQIQHPNVVSIYGHGTTPGGAPYLVMEFIEGGTLREALETRSISRGETAIYLRQVGSALDEIHAHGVCHRDLKPENLMIRAGDPGEREIVVIDFSIAMVKDPDETLHGLSRAAGTIYYMAPEQGIGYADESTDIYSLAKIVIEMLTGKRLSALLPDASIDLPERVQELLAGLTLGLSRPSIDLIARALEFHPLRRPRDANEFATRIADDLDAWRAEPAKWVAD